jgi:hypothetical protein
MDGSSWLVNSLRSGLVGTLFPLTPALSLGEREKYVCRKHQFIACIQRIHERDGSVTKIECSCGWSPTQPRSVGYEIKKGHFQ